jgi:anti-sigma regulatory factor (Ser/Thr protein kinase)
MQRPPRSASFGRDAGEIARAREFIAAAAREWELPGMSRDLELIVSELVSNALVHGTGEVRVQLSVVDDALRLQVGDDGGASVPQLRMAGDVGVGGWGLRVVDELSDTWGIDPQVPGTLVWVLKSLPGPAPEPHPEPTD